MQVSKEEGEEEWKRDKEEEEEKDEASSARRYLDYIWFVCSIELHGAWVKVTGRKREEKELHCMSSH